MSDKHPFLLSSFLHSSYELSKSNIHNLAESVTVMKRDALSLMFSRFLQKGIKGKAESTR